MAKNIDTEKLQEKILQNRNLKFMIHQRPVPVAASNFFDAALDAKDQLVRIIMRRETDEMSIKNFLLEAVTSGKGLEAIREVVELLDSKLVYSIFCTNASRVASESIFDRNLNNALSGKQLESRLKLNTAILDKCRSVINEVLPVDGKTPIERAVFSQGVGAVKVTNNLIKHNPNTNLHAKYTKKGVAIRDRRGEGLVLAKPSILHHLRCHGTTNEVLSYIGDEKMQFEHLNSRYDGKRPEKFQNKRKTF